MFGGKLVDKWIGPYVITEARPDGVYVKLDLRGELGKAHDTFHVSRLKPYVESKLEWPGRQRHHRPAPRLVDGATEWEVERVMGKKIELEKRKVTKVVEQPVKASGGRVLRKRPSREVTVEEDVPVVWYKLKWKGYDDETWQKASDCHCNELIDEYELLQQRMVEEAEMMSGERTTAAVELGVATTMECWTSEAGTTTRRGRPVVRCSFASAQYVGSAAKPAAGSQPSGVDQAVAVV
jgi:hypothetical protein